MTAYAKDHRQMVLGKPKSGMGDWAIAGEYNIGKTTIQNRKNNRSEKPSRLAKGRQTRLYNA
ncbi:hypothetical protein, partial [Neisseria iguanae]|uniref:hypothetical protein n=1 Tax=Neisseria iguanae TaxID=90242 RepID=UPI001B809449